MCVCIFGRTYAYCVCGKSSFFEDVLDYLVVDHLRVLGTSGGDQWFGWVLRIDIVAGQAFIALPTTAAVVITSLDWVGIRVLIYSTDALR